MSTPKRYRSTSRKGPARRVVEGAPDDTRLELETPDSKRPVSLHSSEYGSAQSSYEELNQLKIPSRYIGSATSTRIVSPTRPNIVSRHDQRRSSQPAPLRGALVGLDPMQSEPDDYLHNPDKRVHKHSHAPTWRGIINVSTLIIIILALLMLFLGYPTYAYAFHEYGKSTNVAAMLEEDSAPLPHRGLIDKDTPNDPKVRSFRSPVTEEEYKLTFSDEFNEPGRTFWPGDDPFFEALDLWYGGTHDYEWYTPEAIRTQRFKDGTGKEEGYLTITMEEVPEHNLNFRSGMLVSWNKLCFQGGYLETEVIFPGGPTTVGYWPAVWTMGNLGRPGYLASTDGLWPYVYDGCDVGILENQTYPDGSGPHAALHAKHMNGGHDKVSNLPGMRASSCTCPGEDHPGPKNTVGRGIPEIDLFEKQAQKHASVASQSYQAAPFHHNYNWDEDEDSYTIFDKDLSNVNVYKGSYLQEAMSVLTRIPNSAYFDTDMKPCKFAIEYIPDKPNTNGTGSVTFYVNGKPSWHLIGAALKPDNKTEVGWRKFSREPLFMIMNLGIAKNFQKPKWSGKHGVRFPAHLAVNYMRLYQKEGQKVTCDPPDYPTSDYIKNHQEMYHNNNLTKYTDLYPWPKNRLKDGC